MTRKICQFTPTLHTCACICNHPGPFQDFSSKAFMGGVMIAMLKPSAGVSSPTFKFAQCIANIYSLPPSGLA